jgi:hypothetical protein
MKGYHPESWMPAWGVRTALTALITFMSTPGEGSVGAIEWPEEQRKLGAKRSVHYVCNVCGSKNVDALPSEEQVPTVEVKSELTLNPTEGKDGDLEGLNAEIAKAMKESAKAKDIDKDEDGNDNKAGPSTFIAPKVEIVTAKDISTVANTRVAPSTSQTQPSPPNQHPWLWSIDVLIIIVFGLVLALSMQLFSRK